MKTYKYLIIFSVVISVLLSGCESLDVKNENDPDFKTSFSDPAAVKGVAGSLINSWFLTTQNYDGPALMLWVGADAGTCSWGNANMRWFSNEPRVAFDNSPSYADAATTEVYYAGLYSTLSYSNDVLSKVVKEGMEIITGDVDETKMVEAVARLSQGLCLGYIGLIFDKAFIVTENTDITQTIPTSPFKDVIDSALVSLDECIAICNSNDFELPSEWIPGMAYTNEELGQLANTVAAMLLSYSPRSKAENDAVNWAKVLTYANNGITFDFAPKGDNYIKWYSNYKDYGNSSGWGQTDMRIVNMMDSRFPSRWADANTWDILPAAATTHTAGIDDRVFTDFQFLSSCGFRTERGYYHFSCYRFSRYDQYLLTYTELMPTILKAENDLLKAEALLHQPNLAAAQGIINAGTRVTRGGLAPIGATATEIENAIFHERNVELYCTGMGVEFFTMRKADKLQKGTPLHLPIPGQQLEVNVMDNYSFGGTGDALKGAPGVDVSNGGWF